MRSEYRTCFHALYDEKQKKKKDIFDILPKQKMPGVAVLPWSTETVLSPWLAADEIRVSHVLSRVVWWKKKEKKDIFHILSR